jgi:hypothetical protein
VEIRNNAAHHFSYPVDGTFSFKTKGAGNTPISNVFYLSEGEVDYFGDGIFIREIPIRLKKSDGRKKLNLYINFDEFPNPVDHCDYTVNSYFNDDIVKTLNIRINRSKEETEALVQIVDGDDALPLDMGDDGSITDDNCLLVHKKSKSSIPISVNIPTSGIKGIKEGIDTRLFTMVLKNNCSTRTGFYNWELKGVSVTGNSEVEFEGNPLKINPNENTGAVSDHRDSEQEIEFSIDHSKIKKISSYRFDFSLKFSLNIWLFPRGEVGENPAPAGGQKQIDFSVDFLCFHDVKDNYLVIDFGTSAICAFYYTHYPETLGDNYRRIPLQSPPDHLPSEDDLLPSIVNLRNAIRDGIKDGENVREEEGLSKVAVAGTEHFVDLPARKGVVSGACPESVLNSIKLLIVQGMLSVPIPEEVHFGYGGKRPFVFINENGKQQKGNPSLESVLKSCYENLLNNYIDSNSRRYRKVVLTYPNVYNHSHISFLENHVFKHVFQESGRLYFENIRKESESNCVLYYYLMKRKKENVPDDENVLVIDIGAGTLDMSYAQVEWDKSDSAVISPRKIRVIKRDGIAMAGDTLDKAIALQAHTLLKKFTGFEGFNYANRIASNGDLELNAERKLTFKTVMFAFKTEHILNYKKSMTAADNSEIVEICLGENDENNGLCEIVQEIYEITADGEEGSSATITLVNRYGKLYIGMNKEDWLNLPYLKRFEQLLIGKLGAFCGEIDVLGDLTIVLSGRTSLWPALSKAVDIVFDGISVDMADNIWPGDPNKKAAELKRAVILGAIQKATTWKEVEFEEAVVAGIEAVRYQKDADGSRIDSWQIITFQKNPAPGIAINLANSSYFELGVKTSLDFVPFMGADCYKRDDYCKKDKKITITREELDDGSGYHFYVKSDRYQKGKGTRLKHVLSHETAFLRTRSRYWPVRDAQLPEISSEQFNENV